MTESELLFLRAQKSIPGGVNSPVRAFQSVGGTPLFIQKGEGVLIYDADNNSYIDYVASWGPLIHGHANPFILEETIKAMQKGLSFGAPTEGEIILAERIIELIPSIEKLRLVNSGTEATMTAIRLARGFTKRSKILKFQGCYHGHSDSLLVKAGSGALTLGCPSSPGVPQAFADMTLNAEFNNPDSLHQLFAAYGDDIACVIIEPIAGNMGCVPPINDFLRTVRQVCDNYGALLIFDEVITGFRVGLSGAQGSYGIKPDLSTFGKIIGGGMPVGALGGKASIMDHLAPMGSVYQAGTLSGNPVAVAAGLATLTLCSQPGFYETLAEQTLKLVEGIRSLAKKHSLPLVVNHMTGMFSLFFTESTQVTTYDEVMASNTERFNCFYHKLLQEGIYFGPSAFETSFVSSLHTDEVIQSTLERIDRIFKQL